MVCEVRAARARATHDRRRGGRGDVDVADEVLEAGLGHGAADAELDGRDA